MLLLVRVPFTLARAITGAAFKAVLSSKRLHTLAILRFVMVRFMLQIHTLAICHHVPFLKLSIPAKNGSFGQLRIQFSARLLKKMLALRVAKLPLNMQPHLSKKKQPSNSFPALLEI